MLETRRSQTATLPLFDLPGFESGQELLLRKGSRLNLIGIGGTARMERLTASSAKIWVKGGRFGIKREGTIEILATRPGEARIIAVQRGDEAYEADLHVIEQGRGFVTFELVDRPGAPASLVVDEDSGDMVLDFVDPRNGDRMRLVLCAS